MFIKTNFFCSLFSVKGEKEPPVCGTGIQSKHKKQYQQNRIFLPVLCKNSATQNTLESILTRITFHFLLLDMDFYATLDATK
jgi:hypothetical protein